MYFITILACLSCESPTPLMREEQARQVGVDLSFDGPLLVQEIWRKSRPRLLLANRSDKAMQVELAAAVKGKPQGKALAGPWKIPPHDVVDVDAEALKNRSLIAVRRADGEFLGLLRCADPPHNMEQTEDTATYSGLNGLGGPRHDLWFSQKSTSFDSGEEARMTVTIAAASGRLVFGEPEKKETGKPAIEAVRVLAAQSDSLKVERLDSGGFAVETRDLPAGLHTIRLRIRTPRLATSTLAILPCRLEGAGRVLLDRGLYIKPERP